MATNAIDRSSKIFRMEESLRIAVQKQIESFIANDELQTLQFPVSFTNTQRGFVHKYVQGKGLKSKSHGKGVNRCLTVYKPNTNTVISCDATLKISPESSYLIKQYLSEHKVTDREISEAEQLGKTKHSNKHHYGFAIFKLSVPPKVSVPYHIIGIHIKLPITNYRQSIVDTINKNRVLVIAGDTGSGKTTQVPQYILDHYAKKNEPCRIICTQPRRIAAVSMADRVAFERNETVGNAVGYQIRLESKVSPGSNLIYTTSGFLLRCLISDVAATWLSRVTHIIMDEVHERDKFTDFLFIALKEILARNEKLKIILMSATIDTDIFTTYFDCPLVTIPGRMHPVRIHQLEDVLGMLGQASKPNEKEDSKEIKRLSVPKPSAAQVPSATFDDERNAMINYTLQECFYGRSDFDQFFYLVTGEGVDVNVPHSETNLNALMIAAIKNQPEIVETLLKMGANPRIIGGLGYTATEWAERYNHLDCWKLLKQAENFDPSSATNEQKFIDDEKLLQLYLEQTNETEIDHALLFNTIKHIHEQMPDGSILVFLPGYDSIVEQMNTIREGDITANIDVSILHGNMETSDQKKIFAPAPTGTRKIILSTNIAETSLTIDDVVYVIDCGKVKQISYDSLSESTSLTSTWISKACAKQRMGRAGRTRPGHCYRLYSMQRFNAMEEFTLPELLRIPLTELCLHARIMTKTTIADYLSRALQPPPASTINQSIRLLKAIGALSAKEDVTELGYRLVDLPVDVQLGKMLLYSIALKCLDPVLTIVSALSVKDPFVLNFDTEPVPTMSRKTLADNSFSDLMVFIVLYRLWMQNKAAGQDFRFCRENRINSGIMELINGFRSQILGQLRTIGFVTPRGVNDMSDLNQNSSNYAVVKACFVAGFYPNVCHVDRKMGNLKSKQEKKLLPHITSVLREKNSKSMKSSLANLPSEWIVYEEKSRVERLCLVRNNTVVTPLTVALFGGPMYVPKNSGIVYDDSDSENDECMTVKFVLDDWICFVCDEPIALMLQQLRIKLNGLFMKTLCSIERKTQSTASDNRIVEVIAQVLETTDAIAGFPKCSKDMGTRPILLPIKGGNFRNKSRIIIASTANGNLSQQKYFAPSNQQISYRQSSNQQWDRAVGAHRSNQSNGQSSLSAQNQTDTLYYRNEAENEARAASQRAVEFETYVSSFKKSVSLTSKVRYFIIHAESKAMILESFKSSKKWPYKRNLLDKFKGMKKSAIDVDIVAFFLIPNVTFFGMGRLTVTRNHLWVDCFSSQEVSLSDARSIDGFPTHNKKRLEEFGNGDEISNIRLAEKMFSFFLGHWYTGYSIK